MASLSRTISEASGSLVSESSNPVPPEMLVEMEDEAIKQLIEQTEQACKGLQKEVDMFEKFVKRLDPKDTHIRTIPGVSSTQMDGRTGQRKKTRQKLGSTPERLLRLSVEQKYDIATRELDELREEMVKKREERQRVLDNHKAMITESEHKLTELSKARYEFERDILRSAVNIRTGKLLGEKVIKYFEDYIRSRDNLMEKLRLKNSTMRVKRQKLMTQLKQKEESGEVRHEVDFEQLKIENKQLHEKVEEKNKELLELKLSSGNTMQVLNSYKQKVQSLTSNSKSLDNDIKQHQDLLERVETETTDVIKEKEKAEEVNKILRSQLEDYRVPDIMEYVQERASQYELKKTLHVWQRKVEIAEMTLRTYQQTWQQLTKQSHSYQHFKSLITQ